MTRVEITASGGGGQPWLQALYMGVMDALIRGMEDGEAAVALDGEMVAHVHVLRAGAVSVYESPSLPERGLAPYIGVGGRVLKAQAGKGRKK